MEWRRETEYGHKNTPRSGSAQKRCSAEPEDVGSIPVAEATFQVETKNGNTCV